MWDTPACPSLLGKSQNHLSMTLRCDEHHSINKITSRPVVAAGSAYQPFRQVRFEPSTHISEIQQRITTRRSSHPGKREPEGAHRGSRTMAKECPPVLKTVTHRRQVFDDPAHARLVGAVHVLVQRNAVGPRRHWPVVWPGMVSEIAWKLVE